MQTLSSVYNSDLVVCVLSSEAVRRVGTCMQTAQTAATVKPLTSRHLTSPPLGHSAHLSSGTTWAASQWDHCKWEDYTYRMQRQNNNARSVKKLSSVKYLLFSPHSQVLLKHGNISHEVWSQTGNQGNKWKRGEVFLGLLNNFQVCTLFCKCYIIRFNAHITCSVMLLCPIWFSFHWLLSPLLINPYIITWNVTGKKHLGRFYCLVIVLKV